MRLDNLLLERDGAVAVLPTSRPRVLSTLNTQTISELRDVALNFVHDATVRVVILIGVGGKGR